MLPQHVQAALQQPLQDVQHLHTQDLEAGGGGVYLPYALERKYPNAHHEWVWQYVFPATRLSRDPRTGSVWRHHMHKLILQRAVHAAVRKANIAKPASCTKVEQRFDIMLHLKRQERRGGVVADWRHLGGGHYGASLPPHRPLPPHRRAART